MPEISISLLVSACLGALIGLIRQWEEQQERGETPEFVGMRTCTLVALLGTTTAYVSELHSAPVFLVGFALVGLYLALSRLRACGEASPGYTTFAATALAYLIGGLSYWRHWQVAAMLAAATMLLLGFKHPIHAVTRQFTVRDIRATLQFAAITGVVLPVVPNRPYGPYDAFNPYSLWLMVVLISGLGFVGYLLMRLLGAQAGITLTGVVGGLASSTATTLAFSRRSRDDSARSESYALAIVLACTIMLARVAVVCLALSRDLFAQVWLTLLCLAVPGLGFAVWRMLRRSTDSQTVEPVELSNPLSLGVAIKFGLIYAAVNFLVKAAAQEHLTQGLLGISFLSGLTDMDAITVSMADSVQTGQTGAGLAAQAVGIAAVANTLLKGAMAAAIGSTALRTRILVVLGATAAAGLAAVALR